MTRAWRHIFVIPVTVMLIAVVSVFSAAQMAPDRTDPAFEQAALLGMSASDLCGDEETDHHCPFCRLLPETPEVAPAHIAVDFRPADGWRQLTDRFRAAQARRHAQTPRAPPSIA